MEANHTSGILGKNENMFLNLAYTGPDVCEYAGELTVDIFTTAIEVQTS